MNSLVDARLAALGASPDVVIDACRRLYGRIPTRASAHMVPALRAASPAFFPRVALLYTLACSETALTAADRATVLREIGEIPDSGVRDTLVRAVGMMDPADMDSIGR